MKWFKHDTNASNDVKLARLINLYGYEGYGIYFKLLELIASPIEVSNFSEWGYLNSLYNDDYLASNVFKIDVNRFKLIKKSMIRLGLFVQNRGRISCPTLLNRLDEYAEKAKKKLSNADSSVVGTLSGLGRDKVVPNRIEENRIDKNRTGSRKHTGLRPDSDESSDLKNPKTTREILQDKIAKRGGL